MIDYSLIKSTHLTLVLVSGGLFSFRGVLMLLKSPFSQHRFLKRLSYINDTGLLLAGVVMAVKLVLLPIYILLGLCALRLAPKYGQRLAFFIAALAVYGFMFSVAKSHHPWGLMREVLPL